MGFVSLFAQPGVVIEEPKEPEFASELDFLDWLWKQPSKPDRLRFQAAAEVAKYRNATLKATTQVTPNDFAAVLDRAKERAANANVIKLQVLKAIEHEAPPVQHSADELKPSPGSASNGSGFRRRF
jgi:hypothetical protein